MFLHITFTDGSNPYVKQCIKDYKTLQNEIKKWRKNYIITGYNVALGFMATAEPK